MIDPCFAFACSARMRVPSSVFPGRLRFAGNIFTARGLSPFSRPHTYTRGAFIFGEWTVYLSRENTDRCTMQRAESSHRRAENARNVGVKLWSERDRHRNLLFTAGPSQILLSLTRTSRRSICARVRSGQAWERIHVRCNHQPGCASWPSLWCVLLKIFQ